MIEVIILAIALSMDAFAVSIALGSRHHGCTKLLAIMVAIYFGFFQGLMPLIGYFCSESFLIGFASYATWFSFALLCLISLKMIYESMNEAIDHNVATFNHRVILTLAIATSIDTIVVGFTIPLLDTKPFITCFIISITTMFVCCAGVYIGAKGLLWLKNKAEFFGGVLLISVGLKVAFF